MRLDDGSRVQGAAWLVAALAVGIGFESAIRWSARQSGDKSN